LFPGTFSTLSLGLERTGLAPLLNSTAHPHAGGTFFTPTNTAFRLLGPRINAFLFSPFGKKYLKALLEYHIIPEYTVYSTALYNGTSSSEDKNLAVWEFMGRVGEHQNAEIETNEDVYSSADLDNFVEHDDDEEETESRIPFLDDLIRGKKPKHPKHPKHGKHPHPVKFLRLPTLLANHSMPVVIFRKGPFAFIKVNRYGRVIIKDGLASDGVIQVVNRVLIPPHKHRGGKKPPMAEEEFMKQGGEDEFPVDMSVEEFKERMEPYLPVEEKTLGGCGGKKEQETKMEF
jgi:uncharacterized surface protein with fasciclin (FAS1) repeats